MEIPETASPVAPPPEGADLAAFTVAYLAAHEAECPACGYNVHALRQPRCPECGRPLAVRIVAAVGGFSRAWTLLLTTTAVAAGVGMFNIAVLVHETMPAEISWRIILFYFIVNIPLAAGVLTSRKRFLNFRRPAQWMSAISAALLTIFMIGWFVVKVMRS